MKNLSLKLAAAALFALAAACGGDGGHGRYPAAAQGVPVTGVGVSQPAVTLAEGAATTLRASVYPAAATNRGVAWASDRPDVATVAGDGHSATVTAVAAGAATITVSTLDGGLSDACRVTVEDGAVPVAGLSLAPVALTLAPGNAERLEVGVNPSNATNQGVTWTSSNAAVATVSPAGAGHAFVRAVANGAATITATADDGGWIAACAVTVAPYDVPVLSIELGKKSMQIPIGRARSLAATLLPPNANPNVVWSTSNAAVATVSAAGLVATVTPVSVGFATITATAAGGRTATCAVAVQPPVAVSRLLLPKSVALKSAGGQAKLAADVWPMNAFDRGVAWTSNDESIASVSGTGPVATVTGGEPGAATITATSLDNPSAKATCAVTVAAGLRRDVYMGGDGELGVIKNGVIDVSYRDLGFFHAKALAVDSDGVLHAVGRQWTPGEGYSDAVYYRNAGGGPVAYFLPCHGTTVESTAEGIAVTYDGDVYVSGAEVRQPGTDTYSQLIKAKLWKKSGDAFVDVPLEGLPETGASVADGVCVSGGTVIVVGITGEDQLGRDQTPTVWVDGAKTVLEDLVLYGAGFPTAFGPDVYMGVGGLVMKIDPEDPSAYEWLPAYTDSIDPGSPYAGTVINTLRIYNGDVYTAGCVDQYPVVWENHVCSLLDYTPSVTSLYSEVDDVFVTPSGAVYANGFHMFRVNFVTYRSMPLLWGDGAMSALPTFWSQRPRRIVVYETAD